MRRAILQQRLGCSRARGESVNTHRSKKRENGIAMLLGELIERRGFGYDVAVSGYYF